MFDWEIGPEMTQRGRWNVKIQELMNQLTGGVVLIRAALTSRVEDGRLAEFTGLAAGRCRPLAY